MKNPTHPNTIRGIDYSSIGFVGEILTDSKIDHYLIEGHYGKTARQNLITRVHKNPKKYPKLLKQIRLGTYGQELQQEFKKPKRARTTRVPSFKHLSTADLLADFLS